MSSSSLDKKIAFENSLDFEQQFQNELSLEKACTRGFCTKRRNLHKTIIRAIFDRQVSMREIKQESCASECLVTFFVSSPRKTIRLKVLFFVLIDDVSFRIE
jgi:hypothetical protein